jgi:hypothetical protein
MAYGTKKVAREEVDPTTGKSLGVNMYTEGTAIGRLLKVSEAENPDDYGRRYIGAAVEVEAGFDRFGQTTDIALQDKMKAVPLGSIVRMKGVEKWNRRHTSRLLRVTEFDVITAAPVGPQLVSNQPAPTPEPTEAA